MAYRRLSTRYLCQLASVHPLAGVRVFILRCKTPLATSSLVMELHRRGVRVTLLEIIRQIAINCSHVWKCFHAKLRHEATSKTLILLVRLLRAMPDLDNILA